MKALVYEGNRKLNLYNYEPPKAGLNEVVIKVSRAAICGTDIHKFSVSKDAVETINGELAIAGHEPSGWISEIGEGVKELSTGQRVLVAGVFSCNTCYQCRSGFNTACENSISGLHWNNHGCNAEYIAIPATNALPIPENISFDTATVLTCAGGTAMTIVKESQLTSGQKLAIIGLGPVGLSLLILAKNMGVQVIGIEVSTKRSAQAIALGIDKIIDPFSENPIEAVKAWTNGLGCAVVAECVGKAVTQLQSLEMAANRGKIAVAGLGNEPIAKNVFDRIIGNGGLQLIGIAATPIKYMIELINLTSSQNLPFDKLITHHFQLEQAKEALALMESGNCGKIIFDIADNFN